MKLAIFVGTLEGGGAERSAVNLANHFVTLGHTVDLVLVRAQGTYLDQGLVDGGVTVIDLKSARTRCALAPWMRYLRRGRPDAVLSLLTDVNLVAIAGAILTGSSARVILSERSCPTQSEAFTGRYERPLRRALIAGLYRRAAAIVCVSRACAEDLARYAAIPRDKIETIYTPVDCGRAARLSLRPWSHPWFTPAAPPVVVALGRLKAQKNFAMLLRAFAIARRSFDFRLMILGEGSERGRLDALAGELGVSSHFAMPGFVENPYPALRRASAFALSSDFEGLPNALLEALAIGCPVVCTRCPSGPEEILEGGRYGRLVPVNDARSMADALVETVRDGATISRERRIERAARFSPTTAFARYAAVLGAGGGGP